jgi:hypothetical protein
MRNIPRNSYIDIVFDGPPSDRSGRFIEVENSKGSSVSVGSWLKRGDGYWVLRITNECRECDERDVLDARGVQL